MSIITRSQWGARNADHPGGNAVARSRRTEFFVHYSTGQELGRTDTARWVREIQAFHMGPQRGWADIGYNFLVDAAGRTFEGRGWDRAGAHCPGHNTQGIGVCFLGNDDPNDVDATPAAKRAIKDLRDEANRLTGNRLRCLGHRDGKDTACPGDELYAWVHAGMPVPGDAPVIVVPPPQPVSVPTLAPPFPLRAGAYFGPRSGGPESVSGYYSHREDLRRWQKRMADRGWAIGTDGLYGPNTADVARSFQSEKGLDVDGLIGPATWRAAWAAPVTKERYV